MMTDSLIAILCGANLILESLGLYYKTFYGRNLRIFVKS